MLISAAVSAGISKKLIRKIGGKVISQDIPPKNNRCFILRVYIKRESSPFTYRNKVSWAVCLGSIALFICSYLLLLPSITVDHYKNFVYETADGTNLPRLYNVHLFTVCSMLLTDNEIDRND